MRVAWGLVRIEVLERAGERRGRLLTALSRRIAIRKARKAVRPLLRWERISDSSYASYTNSASTVRLNRVLEAIGSGKRILDVGIGFGYVTGIVLREANAEYYCGIDVKDLFISATHSMLDANGFDRQSATLEVGDVFALSREFGDKHDPDVVLILEVLEHVDDPIGALQAVAGIVRPSTKIVFTVPMWGRLEGVWGHASTFNRRGLQSMCSAAGLKVEIVEPLQNTWSLVCARTVDAGWSSGAAVSAEEPRGVRTFTRVPLNKEVQAYELADDSPDVRVRVGQHSLRCVLDGQKGGVKLTIEEPEIMRLDIAIDGQEDVESMWVVGKDPSGREVTGWHLKRSALGTFPERRTYVLRPGASTGGATAFGGRHAAGVRYLEVGAVPKPGRKVAFGIHRAAYLAG